MGTIATERVEKRAAAAAIVTSVVLMGVKFGAYLLTGSAAIFSDAVESIVNVVASLVAFYALVLAHRPPDEDHPYGHGKVEFMSSGLEGGMICVASGVIVFNALEALFWRRVEIVELNLGLILTAVSILGNAAVGATLLRLGQRTGSMTLEADGRHLMADAVTSIAALAALAIVSLTGWSWADPVIALLIAAYIAWTGLHLVRRAMGGLMDQQDRDDHALLVRILDAHQASESPARICSYHKLRHRHTGRYHWVDFHIRVPAAMNVRDGHTIATAIEEEIEAALGEGNATAHIEPCGDAACARCSGAGSA